MTISTFVELDDLPQRIKFIDSIAYHLNFKNWKEVGSSNEPDFQNSWVTTTGYHFGFRFNPISNSVVLHGRISPGTETDGTIIFTLPKNYRPSTNEYSYLIVTDTTGSAGARLQINTNGDVVIYNADTAGSFYDVNIIFPLDV